MASEWDFRGDWIGQYCYDTTPSVSRPTPTVSFSMSLRSTWLGGLRGNVQDDPKTGMPERGIIRGKVNALKIDFTKLMPVCHVLLNGKSVRLSVQLGLDYEVPHPEIFYQGEYSPADDTVRGTWLLPARTIRLRSGLRLLAMKFAETTGSWDMSRARFGS